MLVPYAFAALLPFVAATINGHTAPVEGTDTRLDADRLALYNLVQSDMRLVQIDENVEPRWVLEEDKDAFRRLGIRFMDITDQPDLGKANKLAMSAASKTPFPSKVQHKKAVKHLLSSLEPENMRTNLLLLTGFHSRYYKSKYGAASGEFLFNLIQNITSVHEEAITVRQFKHPWGQHSIIARIQGSESNDTVVIGAHQDSANMFLPNILPAPGADDDGSGTVTIMEVLRVLSEANFVPKNSLEFHWYSAEEGGLLGSQAVAAAYEKNKVPVIAMLQQDMTGYVKKLLPSSNSESLGVITDFVDVDLTKFIKLVVETYCSIPYVDTKCGYACSDHASFSKAGYRSAFVIESEFKNSNPYIHTQNDVIGELSFSHMAEHAKLTTGFAVELGLMSHHGKSKGRSSRFSFL